MLNINFVKTSNITIFVRQVFLKLKEDYIVSGFIKHKNMPSADKSLARPGKKQARKHVRDVRDFNNIETRAVIKFFFFLQGKAPKEIHAILTETLACFLRGRVFLFLS